MTVVILCLLVLFAIISHYYPVPFSSPFDIPTPGLSTHILPILILPQIDIGYKIYTIDHLILTKLAPFS